jgi:hypothetical protein
MIYNIFYDDNIAGYLGLLATATRTLPDIVAR